MELSAITVLDNFIGAMSSPEREEQTVENVSGESRKEYGEEKDATLQCRDCGNSFVFTTGEQEFYRTKEFEGPPSRCKPCRAQKKASRDSQQEGGTFGGHMNYMMMDAFGNPIVYQVPQRPPNLRTKPCHAFRRGECVYGADCRYYHDDGSQGPQSLYLNPPPMFAGGFPPGGMYVDPSMVSSGMMMPQTSPHQGGRTNNFSPRNNNGHRGGKSRNPCFAFQRGECNYGDSCRYQHVNASSMTDANGNPIVIHPRGYCHAFARGECKFGDACKYRHEIPTDVDGDADQMETS